MDFDLQRQAQRIDQQMPLAPVDLLATIIAMLASTVCRLD
jgi:hypothetical protein